jgi:hypothetical protein
MPDSTDAMFLDDTMHMPLGVVRTHEAARQNPRAPVSCDVTLTISLHGVPILGVFAIGRNISSGGICFDSDVALAENAEVTIRCVPQSGLEVEAIGRVLACNSMRDGDSRYRVQFVGMSAELIAAVQNYVYDSWKQNLVRTVNDAIGERWAEVVPDISDSTPLG